MQEKPSKRLSVQEYLALEESTQVRHEYVAGRVFAMTGVSAAHNVIALNIASLFRSGLRGSSCTVFMSEMKVRVDATDSFYYPDVILDCGAFDRAGMCAKTPIIIFEVLSRSTASTDRREKLVAYQQIPSLMQYVIVHQTKRRLDVYRNVGFDEWTHRSIVSSGEPLVLEGCQKFSAITLSLEEIYESIGFDDGPDLVVKEDVGVYTW